MIATFPRGKILSLWLVTAPGLWIGIQMIKHGPLLATVMKLSAPKEASHREETGDFAMQHNLMLRVEQPRRFDKTPFSGKPAQAENFPWRSSGPTTQQIRARNHSRMI